MLALLRRRIAGSAPSADLEPFAPGGRGQPVFDAERCDLNGACAAACPVAAITVAASFTLDRTRCISCSKCIEVCPTGALAQGIAFAPPGDAALASVLVLTGDALAREARRVLGRSLHVRHLDAGSCNGCDWEINATTNAVYDIQRFGIDFVASPRHADVLLVTGTMTRALEVAARRTYDAMSDPRLVVAVGACAASGSPFPAGYASGNGAADVLPVDIVVPGCPPTPLAIIDGLLAAVRRRR